MMIDGRFRIESGRSLRGKMFYKNGDNIYCEIDFMYCGFQKTAGKCHACGHMITDKILQALDRKYHPGCFRCSQCGHNLDSQPFAVDEQNRDVVYCLRDYRLRFAPKCDHCCQAILDGESSPAPTFSFSSAHEQNQNQRHQQHSDLNQDCVHNNSNSHQHQNHQHHHQSYCGEAGVAMEMMYVSVANYHFHTTCFRCFDCGKSLICKQSGQPLSCLPLPLPTHLAVAAATTNSNALAERWHQISRSVSLPRVALFCGDCQTGKSGSAGGICSILARLTGLMSSLSMMTSSQQSLCQDDHFPLE